MTTTASSLNAKDLDLPFSLPPLPPQITDPAIPKFLSKYYDISNNGHAEDYAALFASDGEFGMNAKTAKGTKEITNLRRAIWSHVPNRDHKPVKVYVGGGADSDAKNAQYDLMIHGDVAYKHHAGHETGGDWAAVVKLVVEGGELKMGSYRIIVVSCKLFSIWKVVGRGEGAAEDGAE